MTENPAARIGALEEMLTETQATSIYRKFGVSSRSGAIDRMHELGLFEHV